MTTLDLDSALNTLIIEGKSEEAFQRFYAEDVVSQENDEPERHGRDSWMKAREEMSKSIRRFEARVLANAANGDTSFSEWDIVFDLAGVGTMTMVQVAVRRWRDGKVVHERFYHR